MENSLVWHSVSQPLMSQLSILLLELRKTVLMNKYAQKSRKLLRLILRVSSDILMKLLSLKTSSATLFPQSSIKTLVFSFHQNSWKLFLGTITSGDTPTELLILPTIWLRLMETSLRTEIQRNININLSLKNKTDQILFLFYYLLLSIQINLNQSQLFFKIYFS